MGRKSGLEPIITDPDAFLRRLHREGIKVAPNEHPAGLFRQDSRVPEAVKKLHLPVPHQYDDISGNWLFHLDPNDQGTKEGWFSPDHGEGDWFIMVEPSTWENAGWRNYNGVAWYRKWVELPENLKNGPVHIGFGGVADEYDLYVNGKLVTHYGSQDKRYENRDSDTDITQYLNKDGKNLICLRVKSDGWQGGFTRLPIAIDSEAVGGWGAGFNLALKDQADLWVHFHNQLNDQGIDFWWIDGDCAQMDGLNGQLWTNKVYYDGQEKHTGKRSFIFSRYGGPGSHRYPGFFTGDNCASWRILTSEIPYTIKAGNGLSPYVTHDISGFAGLLSDNFELYARWVQFGALSPMLRLHSAHENPVDVNPRLPWVYGEKGCDLARTFFQLRYRLIPYLYTYSRAAHDTGLPLVRGLYLEHPDLDQAYRFDEYLLGQEILVAPVTVPGGKDGIATREIYLPPGSWMDYFTGKTYAGSQTISFGCPLERMPIFMKRGSIIPMQPEMAYTTQKPVDPLVLDVYTGGSSTFKLYEDDGSSLDYRQGKYAWTPLVLRQESGRTRITVGAAEGRYKGQLMKRSYLINIHAQSKPAAVTVNGMKLSEQSWKWDAEKHIAAINVKARPVTAAVSVVVL